MTFCSHIRTCSQNIANILQIFVLALLYLSSPNNTKYITEMVKLLCNRPGTVYMRHQIMAVSCVFQWNLFVDVCFSQHRCSSDRQPPSAHALLLFLLGQWCLIHVHWAHWPEQWPHHDVWNRQQLGQPHLSGCSGLLQITHTYTIHIHTSTHTKTNLSSSVGVWWERVSPLELLMLVCRAALLMYSLFLFPLPYTAVNDCGLKLYHYYCIFAAKNQSMFWCESVMYVTKERDSSVLYILPFFSCGLTVEYHTVSIAILCWVYFWIVHLEFCIIFWDIWMNLHQLSL